MTIDALGLRVHQPDHRERVHGVLDAFTRGFNAGLCSSTVDAGLDECDRVDRFYRPFAHEGLAMSYIPRRLMRFDAVSFDRELASRRPEHGYLYHVGLGFWWGSRRAEPRRVHSAIEPLDVLHRYLCFDGYGFQQAFFSAPRDPFALRFFGFNRYARNAAFQGVGRALYFLLLDDPEGMIAALRRAGEHFNDVVAGLGLAAVFVHLDRFHEVIDLATRIPPAGRSSFQLGMCFGLKARALTDPALFRDVLSGWDPQARRAATAAVEACDQCEAGVRSRGMDDGYRVWRSELQSWLETHLEYPMASINETSMKGGRATRTIEAARAAVESREAIP